MEKLPRIVYHAERAETLSCQLCCEKTYHCNDYILELYLIPNKMTLDLFFVAEH